MPEQIGFRRNMGLFMAVMIGIGAMMGPGIFVLPGGLADRNHTRRHSLLCQGGLLIMVKAFESDGGNSCMIKKNETCVE
jgi:hypothetical protein